MRKIAVTAHTLALAFVCLAAVPDEASAAEFPSAGEIFSTVELPDYSFSTFMDDIHELMDSGVLEKNMSYLSGMVDFFKENTFLNPDYAEPEGGSLVNVFFIICLAICALCIVGAVVSYLVNKVAVARNKL